MCSFIAHVFISKRVLAIRVFILIGIASPCAGSRGVGGILKTRDRICYGI